VQPHRQSLLAGILGPAHRAPRQGSGRGRAHRPRGHRRQGPAGHNPRLVGGLRLGAGGLHHRHGARGRAGRRGIPRARQDLRQRRRRGGARAGAPRQLHRQGRRGARSEARGKILRALERPLRLPEGAAPRGDFRAPRPRPGCADLAPRPAGVPQHAHVLQRRGAGESAVALPLRAQSRRLPVPRPRRDAARAGEPVCAGRSEVPAVRQDRGACRAAPTPRLCRAGRWQRGAGDARDAPA
jgi:hypothetical protein